MTNFDRGSARSIPSSLDMSVDAGLRSFMLGVYNKMGLGLVLSAALAFLTGTYPPVRDLMFRVSDGHLVGYTGLGTIISFAPLAVILFAGFAMRNPTTRSSGAIYWTIVSLMGASLGTVALAYTGGSIFQTFLISAAAFAGLSLVGYTTKKDLTGFGSFLIMGLWGIIIAGIVNVLFAHSGPLSFIINVVGVLIFAGLTAYKTQMLKMTYYQLGGDAAQVGVATNYGALSLYITFINLFLSLLSLFGNRR
jgi:FtsH-binding integral membrane protein